VSRQAAPTGLSAPEAAARRARGLANASPDGSGRSFARILAANVFTVFNAIVGGSFVLLLILGSWQDALFGVFVVANTAIGVVQEFRAKRTLDRLAVLNAPRVLVRRDGVDVDSAAADVVLGDLLALRPGDQVAADARLVECRELELDESVLTGEAEPVSATNGRELLSGSSVVGGTGLAVVTRVGLDSYAARITAEARQFALVDSELRRTVARIVRWLSIGLIPVGAIVVNGQMRAAGGWSVALASGAWREAAITSVASLIAMIPAGLVFMTSVGLTLGAVRLAGQQVLVREIAADEGLARVDIVCLDKTGTLTEGAMVFDRVELVDEPVDGWRNARAGLAADPVANATARAISADVGHPSPDSTPPDAVVAFSSRYKWSAVHFHDGSSAGTWMLGGADVLFGGSSAGGDLGARAAALARSGERVLVLAHSDQPIPERSTGQAPRLPRDLDPVAIIALRERVRSDAAETLRYFGRQGVEVCVMSGDDPQTVAAIAHQVGLPATVRGLDARDLPSDPIELADVLRTERLFGRVTPEQKKAMVLALRSLGHTVAMIGDGVNDALALKHADLGIAMGSGSGATRAVAQVVLLDNAFARLPRVVAEGRQVIANVERLAKLFLSKTVYAIALALTFGLLLWPFPFLPRHLSVVDGLTIGLPALVIALLPNTRIYRPGFLRRAAAFCVPSGLVVAGAVFAIVAYATLATSASTTQVRTAAVVTLTLSGLWVLVVLLRPFTPITLAVVALAYGGLIAVLVIPFARAFLQLDPSAPHLMLAAVAASLIAGLLLEVVSRARGLSLRDQRPYSGAPPRPTMDSRT